MLCRMCLLESSDVLSILEYGSSQFQIAATIARHFWFEPTKDDSISNMICYSCWMKIEDFHMYYISIEEAQLRLPTIIKQESVPVADLKDMNVISVEEADKTEDRKYTDKIGEFYVPEYEEFTTYTDPIIDEDFSTSDDEILAKWKSTDREALKSEDMITIELDILKMNDNSMESKETVAIDIVSNDSTEKVTRKKRGRKKKSEADSTERITQKKRGRKKKSEAVIQQSSVESDNQKNSKKFDEAIAQQTKLKCDLCLSEFTIFSQLQRHYRTAHGRKGYMVCCSKAFFKRGTFLDHISRHVNPECFKCNECNKIYANRRSLKSHTLIHHPVDLTVFECDQCPRRFTKSHLLNKHKRNSHIPKDANKFFCEECGKGFNKKMSLQSHRRCIHDNAYTQMCHICAKLIRGKTLFAKHQLEHAGISEPKEQCQECGVWLKNAFRLKLHMKTHAEVGNAHICNLCGKSSTSRVALKSHQRYVHSAKRRHQCRFCDKAFKEPLILKEHIATHTGDILYTCPHCPKTFNSKSNMHSHRKKMHRKEWEETRQNRRLPAKLLLASIEDDQAIVHVNDTVSQK